MLDAMNDAVSIRKACADYQQCPAGRWDAFTAGGELFFDALAAGNTTRARVFNRQGGQVADVSAINDSSIAVRLLATL